MFSLLQARPWEIWKGGIMWCRMCKSRGGRWAMLTDTRHELDSAEHQDREAAVVCCFVLFVLLLFSFVFCLFVCFDSFVQASFYKNRATFLKHYLF
jgi:hypothetical protein